MSGVQTILSNQNATINVVTDSYVVEQRGSWALELNILEDCNATLNVTMQVSNDNVSWRDYKVIDYVVKGNLGGSWTYNYLPFDFVRFVINSKATKGRYKLLFNERG